MKLRVSPLSRRNAKDEALLPSSGGFADGLTVSGGVDLRANLERALGQPCQIIER